MSLARTAIENGNFRNFINSGETVNIVVSAWLYLPTDQRFDLVA